MKEKRRQNIKNHFYFQLACKLHLKKCKPQRGLKKAESRGLRNGGNKKEWKNHYRRKWRKSVKN
jgi:hypothetical protein